MGISLFRSIAGQYEDLRAVNSVAIMNAISHQIEEQVINHSMPVDFYAGFQRFSQFPAQLRRYGKLGATCRRVYVFGVADVKPPVIPGIEFIDISPTSPLAREWFLVVDTPEFWTALLTQEVEGRDVVSGGRRFDGLWTYDQQVVERAALLLTQELDMVYKPVRQRDHEQQSANIAEISARMMSRYEKARLNGHRRWVELCTLNKVAEVLAARKDTQRALDAVAQVLHSVFGAADVAIAVTGEQNTYHVVATAGDATATGRTVQAGDGPSGRALADKTAVCVADARRGREREALLPVAQSIVAAPLVGRSGVHGVLTIGDNAPRRWTDESAQTLTTVASMLAAVLDEGDSSEAALHEERAKRLGQVVVSFRKPMAHILDLEQHLREESGKLQPSWRFLELLSQLEQVSLRAAQAIGVDRSSLELDRSQ